MHPHRRLLTCLLAAALLSCSSPGQQESAPLEDTAAELPDPGLDTMPEDQADTADSTDSGEVTGTDAPADTPAPDTAPILADLQVPSPATGIVEVTFTLAHAASMPCHVTAAWRVGDGLWAAATLWPATDALELATSPEGVAHTILWNTPLDLGKRTVPEVTLRLTPWRHELDGAPMAAGPLTVQNKLFALVDATENLPALTDETRHGAAGDLDGDGDQDLVLAVGNGPNLVLFNDGAGHFQPTALGTANQETACVIPFHLDGDGILDLFIGNVNLPSTVLMGDGQGGFTESVEALSVGFAWQIERVLPGDLDMDGDTDLIVLCSGSQQERLLVNDHGVLVDATADQLPVDTYMAASGSLGSVDGEGPPDLVFASFLSAHTTRLWRNDGQGVFTDESHLLGAPWESMGFDAVLTDLDGDGDLDLFEASTMAPQRVLLNDGAGNFTPLAQAIPAASGPFGNGTFLAVDAAAGDLNLDGSNDVLLGCSGNTAGANDEQLLLGAGNGTLSPMVPSPFGGDGGDTRHVLLFDMDGDGDLDVFVANAYQQSRLYLNQ